MFTGMIEAVGKVHAVEPLDGERRVTIEAPWSSELAVGESVAVDGCCLTVVERDGGMFTVEAVRETLERTIINGYAPGRRVNLERALVVGERLGGHFVQGHVDRTGAVGALERQEGNRYITVELPAVEDLRLIAPQGSIALNGVSLTVVDVGPTSFRVAIIPHTWKATSLRDLAVGGDINVEYDVIARYIHRIMELR